MNKAKFNKLLTATLAKFSHTHIDDWDMSLHAISERVRRVMSGDFDFFVNTYFPHYVRSKHKSRLHEYLFTALPDALNSPKSVRLAIAAPRGEAKSTIVSQLHTLYRIITNRTRYAIIIMDSIDQAYPMLDAIKDELENNPRLKCDFPHACGIGRVWKAGIILTKTEIKIEVAGAGKRLRGKRHRAYRPDFVVLDDIENDKNVEKPAQRDKLHAWLTKAVLPLGAVGEKMDIVYIGTILHHDSVLNRTLNNPSWRTARFRAIIQYPDNMALWDEWESLYQAKLHDEAHAFYTTHKDEMEQGAVVSWLARPLLELMEIRATNHGAFDSEYQNDPTAGDDAPFNGAIHYWANLPDNLIYFGACDPSLGKKGSGRDPSAIIILGLDKTTGKTYCVRADIKKRLPDRIISDIISYQREFDCMAWAVESVQFQEFFRTELIKRGGQAGVPIPAIGVKPTSDKHLRIETLQPHMANQMLLLHPTQTTLIDQLRHFPKADHDDGADGLEMVFKLATSFGNRTDITPIDIPIPSYF